MLVLVNPNACQGKAVEKWEGIKKLVDKKAVPSECIRLNGKKSVDIIANYINKGETEFVAAGGDGTINNMLNDIVNSANGELKNIKLGAIGLGSSNDFHKPFDEGEKVNGVYCKIDFSKIRLQDICKITYVDEDGKSVTKCFLLNSGIGLTADANMLFNKPDKVLSFLKKKNTDIAIIYAALKTIFTYRNKKVRITAGNVTKNVNLTNIGIVKNPNFSGNFCYDSEYKPDSGMYNVHYCENMTLPRILLTLYRLSRKKFSGYRGTTSFETDNITIESDENIAVEFDGEVIYTKKVTYSVLPVKIKICV
jgi:diacylglycerol kinase (ATP)